MSKNPHLVGFSSLSRIPKVIDDSPQSSVEWRRRKSTGAGRSLGPAAPARGGCSANRRIRSANRPARGGFAGSSAGRRICPRAPPEEVETDALPGVEPDVLPFQPEPLHRRGGSSVAAEADSTLRVDHAMPGNAGPVVEGVQRVADEPRLTGQARESRDLSIGRHPAARNAGDHRIDPPVAGGRRHPVENIVPVCSADLFPSDAGHADP